MDNYFKLIATVDITALIGVLTVSPQIGLERRQAGAIVLFLGISLGAALWGLYMLADPRFNTSPANNPLIRRLVWGCYLAAFFGLVAAIVGLISTFLCGPGGEGLCATWR